MKKKLIILFLLSFVFTGKAQCWSESDKVYRLWYNSDFQIIRADGSLWYLVVNPTSEYLTQVGTDTNWDKLLPQTRLYLKTDGTLWTKVESYYNINQWTFNPVYPGTNWKDVNYQYGIKTDGTMWRLEDVPTQIGTDTNWTEFDDSIDVAKKADGTLWWIGSSYPIAGTWVEFANSYNNDYNLDYIFGIKDDGTLWTWNSPLDLINNTPIQIGLDTDWVKIGRDNNVAFKANGTMWQINASVAIQIGTDNDWESSKGDIARKIDGSYWAKGAFNMLYNTISYVSNPDYNQYKKILPEGTYIDYTLGLQISYFEPYNRTYNIIAVNNNNELFAWGQFGDQWGVTISYPNSVQIGCEATLNTNQTSQKEISVFPNPVTDILNIQIEDQLNNAEIFDMGGRLLQTEKIINNQINMSQLQRGIYFVKINGTDKVYSIKISKE